MVSLFLRYGRQPGKICRRSLGRQLFEMMLLMALEPRTSGLILEKSPVIRIVITTLILSGFTMRKNFCAKLNSIFAYETYDYVSDLDESLLAHAHIEWVITQSSFSFNLIRQTVSSKVKGMVRKEAQTKELDQMITRLLRNDAILIGSWDQLKTLPSRHPFLPVVSFKCGPDLPLFSFPVNKNSIYYRKLYWWLQVAFDSGIHQHATTEAEMIKKIKGGNWDAKLLSVFRNSSFGSHGQYSKETNVLLLSKYEMLFGYLIAALFLLHETLDSHKNRNRHLKKI